VASQAAPLAILVSLGGWLYFKQGEIKSDKSDSSNVARAAQWLEKANEISPNNTRCLHILQVIYAQTGNINQINKVNNKLKELTNQ